MLLRARAPAKVNLTLHVLGRRADGFHALDSIVMFAGCAADALTLEPGGALALGRVDGRFADTAGSQDDNLVLKAAREAAARIGTLKLGSFTLTKRIPVAAGLGGGSADAAAALRLIAELNGLAPDDPRLVEAAAATGSDVPACLVSRAARMTGRGEIVEPVDVAPLAAVLMNPLRTVSTAEIFRALGLEPGDALAPPPSCEADVFPSPPTEEDRARGGGDAFSERPAAAAPYLTFGALLPRGEKGGAALAETESGRNDLEPPARALLSEIGDGIAALRSSKGCRLARMSGSGATVFGLYDDQRAARRAARALGELLPGWWIRPTLLR